MVKRFKMLALILVLVFQTVILPITATAQAIEHEGMNTESPEKLDGADKANVSEKNEDTEKEKLAEDGTEKNENEASMNDDASELPPEVAEEIGEIDTNDDASGESSDTEEVTGDDPNDDATEISSETNEKTDVHEKESIIEETKEITEATSESQVDAGTAEQEASERYGAKELGKIFMFDYFKKDDVDIVDGTEIEFNTEYRLQYRWDTVDLDVKAGDIATLPLPEVFKKWAENTPAKEIKISDGTVVGTYTISGGFLQFTFNENIENASIHNGFVGLSIEFDQEKFLEEWEQEIDFDGDGTKDCKVLVKPKVVETQLFKEGHPDQSRNAKEITWSIEIINGSDKDIANGRLKDTLPEGLGEPRNFVIKEITFDFEGNKKVGQEIKWNDPIIDGHAFELTFDHVPARGGVKVEYTTTITDHTSREFTNDASFTDEDGELTANTTVHTGERSNPIQKNGTYNWNTGQIDWTIVVNENGLTIDHAIVHDTLPAELKFVDGSIRVTKNWQTIDNNEWTSFPITLGKIRPDEVYRIQFSTSIDWSQVNDGAYVHFNKFTNETELTDGEEPRGKAEAEVGFWRETLLSKSGNVSDYNYDNKVLTWSIHVNKAKHPIHHAVITDILPAGLDIKESDITVKNETGGVVKNAKITITPLDDGRTEIKINLGNIGTETFQITYQTEVKDFNQDHFTNTASLDGDGIGKETPKDDTSVTPPGNVYKKEYKDKDYSKKTIDWTMTVDPRREGITDLVIEDTFPNNGLILLPDSVIVKIGNKKLAQDTDYTLMPNTIDGVTGYNKGFTIRLMNISEDAPLNEQVTVDFETSYDPQTEVEGNTLDDHTGDPTIFKNHAGFTGKTVNGHEINKEDGAQTKVRIDSWNSGKKEGQLVHVDEGNLVAGWKSGYDRKIAWQLYTNYQKQNLGTGVMITDTLDYEGTIDKDSIQVFVYKVNKNGATEITNEKLSADQYDVNVDGEVFTLTFKETVSERYVVTFTTTVPDISQAKYTNTAIVKVGDKEYPYSGTVNYDKWNVYLGKQALGQNGHEVFIGEELEWDVTVNENLSTIKNARITDTISAGLTYVDGSLLIMTSDGSELEQDKDYELTVALSENGETLLDIDFKENVTQALTLNYRTVVVATNGQQVNNKVHLNGIGVENKSVETERLTAKEFSWVGGELNPNLGAIKVQKVDSETKEMIKTGEARFELWFELNDERVQFGEEFITTNGVLEIGNLPLRTYYLKEVESPKGYLLSDKEIEIMVDKTYNNNEANIVEVNFENIAELEISVEKVWRDVDNQDGIRPDSITVNVLSNEKIVDSTRLNAENDWSATFTGLSPIDEHGDEIVYTVEEVAVDGYETSISGTSEEGFVITNKYRPEKININGRKIWEDADNQDGKRPDLITVHLLANGEVVDRVEVTAEDKWNYAFTDLPKFESGEEITYTVQEEQVAGYSTEIDGFDITNSYTPKQTSINVVKAWNDVENQDGIRPESITVKLLADGEETDQKLVLNEENNWQGDFTELDIYANGKTIKYTIEEASVAGYEAVISGTSEDGFVITNTHEPELIDIDGTKTWEDAGNQDGKRPNSITVHLLANGEEINRVDVTAENEWKYTFTDLPKFENGEEIIYTVQEEQVEGYSTEIDGFNITNSYTPEVLDIPVNKAWDDADNQDGKRPNSLTVNLLANSEVVETVEIRADKDWTHTFKDLPKFAKGEEINYAVQELHVEDYSTAIDGFTITNSYTPGKTSVNVLKVWNDANNQDSKRPESIEIILLADGEVTDQKLVLSEENNWQGDFIDLEVYGNGQQIKYTVEETLVEDSPYITEIEGEQSIGYTITNSYTPESVDVSGTKTWEDAGNQDGKRPDSITVHLLANGEEINRVDVTAKNEWKYTFTDLPKFENGEEIIYTVQEEQVEGYSTEIDGFNITNNYTPEVLDIPVNKAWDDADNQDGKRPDSVTVNLLANDEVVKTVEIRADKDWTHIFKDLPKFAKGEEISYAVQELHVEDYSPAINGFTITNSYTPGKTSVNVLKVWEDAENQNDKRPESIEIVLLANGEATDQTLILNEANNWQGDFTELDEYKDGQQMKYTVEEVAVDEYRTEITGESEIGFVITNTLKTYAIGDYTWIDSNKDGIQDEDEEVLPGVIVGLYDESGEHKLAETRTDENGLYIFDELPAGKYKVKFTLTEEQARKYTFTKQNTDDDSTKDSDADPETGWTKVIELGDENKHLTKDYPDQDFKATEGIDPTWDAGVIEKTPVTPTISAKTKVSVEKVWQGDVQDKVIINLLADGKKVDSVELSEENEWTYTFTDLPTMHKITDKKVIEYTVEEVSVDGYNSEITGNAKEGFTITNTQKTYAIGDYTWIDSNKDGIQDEDEEILPGVKVELLDENEDKIGETVTDENGRYIFDELPAGKYKVKFTLTEEQAEKYEFTKQNADDDSIKDSDVDPATGLTKVIELGDENKHLTKDYTDQSFKATEGIDPTWDAGVSEKTPIILIDPVETKVTVEKIWKGDTDQTRPETITVDLLQNEKVLTTIELTEGSDWTFTMDELPAVDEHGVAYEYTVVEHEVDGYQSTITSKGHTFTITNTFIEEEKSVDPKPENPKPENPKTEDPKPTELKPEKLKPKKLNGKSNGTLPNTATHTFSYLLIGLVLLVLGAITLFIRKRKSE